MAGSPPKQPPDPEPIAFSHVGSKLTRMQSTGESKWDGDLLLAVRAHCTSPAPCLPLAALYGGASQRGSTPRAERQGKAQGLCPAAESVEGNWKGA